MGRSTTGRSSGVSLRSTYTSPVVPEGLAGDARCGPVSGCPAPLPLAPPPVARRRCRSEPVLSANRPPFPKLDPAPVARTSVLAPFTLTRLPVPSFRWRLRTEGSSGAVGVPPWPRPVPRCPWPPASRWLGASKRCPTARRSGCPVLVASERGFSPRPESPPPREPEPFSPSLSPKASFGGPGHPVPVGVRSPVRRIPSRTDNPRSRGIFESPGLSPNFFFNPQKCSRLPPFMHRDVPRSVTREVGFR